MVVKKIKENQSLRKELEGILSGAGYDVSRLIGAKKLILITWQRNGEQSITLLEQPISRIRSIITSTRAL